LPHPTKNGKCADQERAANIQKFFVSFFQKKKALSFLKKRNKKLLIIRSLVGSAEVYVVGFGYGAGDVFTARLAAGDRAAGAVCAVDGAGNALVAHQGGQPQGGNGGTIALAARLARWWRRDTGEMYNLPGQP
jgi:hypothetical protein